MKRSLWFIALLGILCASGSLAQDEEDDDIELPSAEPDLGSSREASRTDDETVQREEEAIKLDGLSVSQMKELREKAEKYTFEAEVNKMMRLIINSLYRNKEIFLRELISNASDALDKIRFLSLTDKSALDATEELSVKIQADEENGVIHITDTGIGMTKDELSRNLGTIAKSGTSEFLQQMEQADAAVPTSDLIGQFGVGFYSSFLVANRVVVTSKSNDDDTQHIWESDATGFSIAADPRGNTLLRGTQISLFMKEDTKEFLQPKRLRDLIVKYSQFINFPIYVWESREEEVEEPVDETEDITEEDKEKEEEAAKKDEEEADVEDEVEEEKEKKPKTKTVKKTVWDWVQVNNSKPIWLRSPKDVTDSEYDEFYKSFSKDHDGPLAHSHFTAEGEVTFKSILFVPKRAPHDLYNNFTGRIREKMKLYVRRVFITDDFDDMMPKYLRFISGVIDSDDLPLNVSREMLQQNKLLMVIKRKLIRKALDMFKKMDEETYVTFWKEFGTSIKLGVLEDKKNRSRLSKLLRFASSNDPEKLTSLDDYVSRMKEKQEAIYFMAGSTREEVENSPFVERLLRRGYEVLYFVEPVDEYSVQNLEDYEKKKFQNVAKEGLTLAEDEGEKQKEQMERMEEEMKPLTDWLKETALKDQIEKATLSNRLTDSPCALVATQYGWSGNMDRIMRSQAYAKQGDSMSDYYLSQKKILEVNPYHPLVQELRRRVTKDKDDVTAMASAQLMYETAVLRSGYSLKDSAGFASRIERMMKLSLGVDPDVQAEFIDLADQAEEEEEEEEEVTADGGGEEEEGTADGGGEEEGGTVDGGNEDGEQVEKPREDTADEQKKETGDEAESAKDEL